MLNEKIDSVDVLIDEYSQLFEHVKYADDLFFGFFELAPFPAWIKYVNDDKIKMFRINREYEEQFGIKQNSYKLQKDGNVWDLDAASKFEENDRTVLKMRRFMCFCEKFLNPSTNKYVECLVWKWPLYDVNGEPIAVYGIITEMKNVQ